MALTIDELNIQIASDSSKATRALSSLIKKLERLKSALNGTNVSNITISNSFNKTTNAVQKTENAVKKYENTQNKTSKNTKNFTDNLAKNISKWRTLFGAFKSAANIMAGWFTSSNDYIETLNLFKVTMGDAADSAQDFAESVQDLMGVDIEEWMRYQGTFKQLTSGFGVAGESANTMSQNLTQLSYDLASFFNTDVETAFDKLSSAMAGQVKGLRDFGIDVTVASLQEYALSKGIEKTVRSMTQAEKSMLRYNYIMEKSVNIQGDMARTLVTPANALRVFKAQVTQLGRALGNIVSVLVVKIIPYVQAFVELMTEAAQRLALFFGFEIQDIDYSGLGGGFSDEMEDAEDALDGASDTLKEIKKQLMGFDELNILNNPDSDAGSGAAGGGGGGLNMEPLEYDFLAGLKTDKIDEIKEKMEDVLTVVGLIAAGVTAWSAYKFWTSLDDVQKKMVGLTLMITGFALEFEGAKEIGNGTAEMWDYIKTALGAAMGIAGSLIVFGTGPAGWIIGITAALTMFIAGFSIGYNEKQLREDLESRFGEIALTVDEMKEFAENLTSSDWAIKLNLYVAEKETLDSLKKDVEKALLQLQSSNFKINIGLSVSEDSYKLAVDNYISSAVEYLTQKQVVATLAVDIIYDKTSTGSRLSDFTASFFSENQQKLSELGAKLKDTVETGFVDGVWIEDKHKEAIELQKEIQEILDYISDVEYQAKIESLKLDVGAVDMDADSFTGILNQAQEIINEQLKNLEGVRLEALKVARMEYDQNILNGMSEQAAQQIYDSAVQEAQKAFNEGKLELNYGTFDFGIDVIMEKYQKELKEAEPVFKQSTKDLFVNGTMEVLPDEVYTNLDNLFLQMREAYYFDIKNLDISGAARENIANLVEALKPTEDQYKQIAESAIAAGQAVPEYVSKGLNDINQLKAISGNVEAINYMVGQKLSTDPSFLDALSTANFAGQDLGEEFALGLFGNLQVIEDAANGTVTFMSDTIGKKTVKVTPELAENMRSLGHELSLGLILGANNEMEKQKKPWYNWALWPWNWFKEKNEINSPSKLFERGGENIMQGLWNGLQSVWGRLTTWWKGLSFSQLSFKMPHFSWSSTPASGWMSTVLDALGLPTSLPKLNISWYAQGGFPSMGEMFIAREAGPELVGSIGRKTAVANNDQIIEGIYNGVYRAMMAANNGKGGNVTVNATFEMDGEVVGRKVIKYHNGVVMQTGESPLLV